ncbi:hypothetical protein J2857_006175 [Neorhizobium galegae]|uniref:hypothetical protein n=1 Tax=Neorhizobium galegae TaxID=399 RepID=UPI001AE11518|nr:hypothetical protein [Neorhizobium galegae]MBP2563376.1 hypothetical protein [Neorhizobium galegae]
MAEITQDQTREMIENLDRLIHHTKTQAFNLATHFHDTAQEKENEAAASLYTMAADQMCVARDAIEAAKALFVWGEDQLDIGPVGSMTALAYAPELKATVLPTTRFWDGPPVWEVLNAPFERMQKDSWYFYINEDAKMMGTLEVCAFIDDEEVPIILGINQEGEDERFTFTPDQWAEYIIPRATKYREAMTTIQEAGPADFFKSLRQRSGPEWAADRKTSALGI